MAESKGSLLAKSVQKHAGRAKEKILRNLGKVDQTADDIFDEHLQNFNQQQAISSRLQKEFNNYIRCVRAMQTASRSLIDVLGEIYESNWADRETFCSQLQNIEILLHDYGHKLADQVLIPMNTYQSQFPEMKKKIDKRGRKLVDYDSQRHNFQNIQQMGKKRDEVKILRAKEQLEEAKRTYELLNSELHDELPALYDSRILFTMTNLQTLFSTEQVFHSETAKLYAELEAIVDKLAMDNQRSPFIAKLKSSTSNGASGTAANDTTVATTTKYDNQSTAVAGAAAVTATTMTTTTTTTTAASASNAISNQSFLNANATTQNNNNNNNVNDVNHFGVTVPSDNNTTNTNNNNNNNNNNNTNATDDDDTTLFHTARSSKSDSKLTDFDSNSSSKSSSSTTNAHSTKSIYCSYQGSDTKSTDDLNDNDDDDDADDDDAEDDVEMRHKQQQQQQQQQPDIKDDNRFNETSKKSSISTVQVPQDATTDGLPDGVYYKVKALFAYEKEDDDELSFETGEILQVIDYDDPDVQEDGWLMGIKESTGEKGMFPENFTKPI